MRDAVVSPVAPGIFVSGVSDLFLTTSTTGECGELAGISSSGAWTWGSHSHKSHATTPDCLGRVSRRDGVGHVRRVGL